MTATSDIVVVSVACANAGEAAAIGRALVERRLAACAQTHAVFSTYAWKGAVETAGEVMLTVKSAVGRLPEIEACVRSLHSYEVPEMVAVPAVWAGADYAAWVKGAVG